MTESNESVERRRRQRFMARRRGEPCFWVAIGDGPRVALLDLSLEGFAVPLHAVPAGPDPFPFALHRAAVPDVIRGHAQVVNRVAGADGGQAGCWFRGLDDDGGDRLWEWLTVHVIANALVPITEKEATAIVSGPSIV